MRTVNVIFHRGQIYRTPKKKLTVVKNQQRELQLKATINKLKKGAKAKRLQLAMKIQLKRELTVKNNLSKLKRLRKLKLNEPRKMKILKKV